MTKRSIKHEKSYPLAFPFILIGVVRLTQNLLKVYDSISAISAHGHLVPYTVFVSQSPEE